MQKTWAGCGLALSLFAGSAAAQVTNFSTDVATAIDSGLDWFDAQDNGMGLDAYDGWCPVNSHGDAVGLVALSVLEKRADADPASLSVGYSGSNMINQGRVDRAINYILARPGAVFTAYQDGADLMALSVYYRTGGPLRPEALTRIRALLDRIFAAQQASGYWNYTAGGGGTDSSTTQLVMAGLSAGRGALLLSILDGDPPEPMDPVSDADRLATLNAQVLLTQQAYFNNGSDDGLPDELGHGYHVGMPNSRQQTASGLWGQLVTGAPVNINDVGIQGYLQWLQNRYRYSDHSAPSNGNWVKSYYYYFWSFSKGMGYLEDQGIAPTAGNIGPLDIGTLPADALLNRELQRDPAVVARSPIFGPGGVGYYVDVLEPARWYFDLASTLLEQQDAAGEFGPGMDFWNDCSSQAYAILVLERSLGGGCIDTDGDGICDPDDNCVNVPNPNQFDGNGNGVGDACEEDQVCCMICEVPVMTSAGQCELSGGMPTGIEQCCPEVCCELPDGTVGMVHTEECVPLGGSALPADQCGNVGEPDICCIARDGSTSTVSPAECHRSGGRPTDDAVCEQGEEVCCILRDGTTATISELACHELQGQVHALEMCEEVCCVQADGTVATTLANECRGEAVAVELCEEVCCESPRGERETMSAWACERQEGRPTPDINWCEPVICCEFAEGDPQTLSNEDCQRRNGRVHPLEMCEEVCCHTQKGAEQVSLLICQGLEGEILADEVCEGPALICCQIGERQPDLMVEGLCEENRGRPVPLNECAVQPVAEVPQGLDTQAPDKEDGCSVSAGADSDSSAWPFALLLLPMLRRRRSQR